MNRGELKTAVPKRDKRKNFTELEKQRMCELYQDGWNSGQIGRVFGILPGSVCGVLERCGVPRDNRTRRVLTPAEKKCVRELYEAGEPLFTAVKKLGISYGPLKRFLAEEGIEWEHRRAKGERSPMWNGGRMVSNGYVYVRVGDNPILQAMAPPRSRGRIAEHRAVLAQALGRPLETWEQVHHINGDRMDNRPENLQLRVTRHGPGICCRCRNCGSTDIEMEEI